MSCGGIRKRADCVPAGLASDPRAPPVVYPHGDLGIVNDGSTGGPLPTACSGLSSRSRTRKRLNNHYLLILLLSLSAGRLTAQVVAGPDQSQQWPCVLAARGRQLDHSEAQAVALGGHLATINDQAEQDWVVALFGQYGGEYLTLWDRLPFDDDPDSRECFELGERAADDVHELGPPRAK